MMDFWKDKTVLLTGGHGFLGRHVEDGLQMKGVGRVIAPTHYEHDFRDSEDTYYLFLNERPDIVIHMAAKTSGIGANQARPGDFFFENAAMGLAVLEATHECNVPKTVMIGTVCSYPRDTPVPFVEENLWNGWPEETNGAYGMGKKMAIIQSQAYRKQYGTNSINLLLANLYGPGDKFDEGTSHVIPALIRRFSEAEKHFDQFVTVWGTGNASREFLFVRDAAEAILLAAERYNSSDPVNIGTGREITIGNLSKWIQTLTQFPGQIVFDPTKPDGQPRRCLDVSKAKEKFGFSARTTIADGLAETIRWYNQR